MHDSIRVGFGEFARSAPGNVLIRTDQQLATTIDVGGRWIQLNHLEGQAAARCGLDQLLARWRLHRQQGEPRAEPIVQRGAVGLGMTFGSLTPGTVLGW